MILIFALVFPLALPVFMESAGAYERTDGLTAPVLAELTPANDRQNQLVDSAVFKIDSDRYFTNNQTIGVRMDVTPLIKDGRTFVPVRFLSNALGIHHDNIEWDEAQKLVTLQQPGLPKINLTIDQPQISVNGVIKAIDVAPLLQDGRTMLPARFVAENLGYQVAWHQDHRAVIIWPLGNDQPDVSNLLPPQTVAVISQEVLATVVTFPDANLEAVVRDALNKPAGGNNCSGYG